MKTPDKDPQPSAKLSAFTGGNMHIFYDCSRQWKIQLGPGVTLEPATLKAGTEGQILIASAAGGLKPDANPGQHILTLESSAGSPPEWTIAVAPQIDICQTPDPSLFLATGAEKTNVVGLISSDKTKALIGILISPAPPEPNTMTNPGGGPPIPRCP